jgi:hypothetical protein
MTKLTMIELEIDYKLLSNQKALLMESIEVSKSKDHKEALTGILHLIDAIQDEAVESGLPEEEVFLK